MSKINLFQRQGAKINIYKEDDRYIPYAFVNTFNEALNSITELVVNQIKS